MTGPDARPGDPARLARPRPTNGTHRVEWPPFRPADADERWQPDVDEPETAIERAEHGFPLPEDRGHAALSPQGAIEYVDDLGRPGRIVVVAGEEGSGKSYTVSGELAIRLAVAGGKFAQTWPVHLTGPVLVLSEMHPDDDYQREETVLTSLGLTRERLAGRYYRLSLMTAAGGSPPLMDDAWRAWVGEWLRVNGALAMIVDTGTAATNVDPWGKEMQQVFRNLRLMLEANPALLIIVIVHLRKPQGRGGERGLSAVMGEWGRWNDVTVMLENDGTSLERVKLTVRKRVRHERRILCTKAGGLLIEPVDMAEGSQPKVPLAEVVATIAAQPAIDVTTLANRLGVSKDTAARYAATAEKTGQVRHDNHGPRHAFRYFAAPDPEQERLPLVADSR